MKAIYKIQTLIAVAALCACLFACEDIIDVELRSVPPRIVIEGFVPAGSAAKVRVTRTKDFADLNSYPTIGGLSVRVWDDAGNNELLVEDASGFYLSRFLRGVAGRTYYLSVEYEDDLYTASSYLPPVVPIDSVTFFKFPMFDYSFPMMHMTDPVGAENDYYKVSLYVCDTLANEGSYVMLSFDLVDGYPVHQILPLFSDDPDIDPIASGDELTVEMQCVDRSAYRFWDTLGNSRTNPESNIEGGALGYFSAYSVTRKTVKY